MLNIVNKGIVKEDFKHAKYKETVHRRNIFPSHASQSQCNNFQSLIKVILQKLP